MKINEKIRELREKHHLSQEEMAEKMNISSSAYGKFERAETRLTITKLEQIAEIFNINIIELINTSCEKLYHNQEEINYFNYLNILSENEKMRLQLQHKDEVIEHLKQEINLLKAILLSQQS